MTGLKARNYQIDQLKFIMNAATEADLKALLVQMQTGSGKSFCQSLLANILVEHYKDVTVLLLHTGPESRHDCFEKYASKNPLAVNVETEVRKDGRRIYYVDFFNALGLPQFIKQNQKRLIVLADEIDTIRNLLVVDAILKT